MMSGAYRSHCRRAMRRSRAAWMRARAEGVNAIAPQGARDPPTRQVKTSSACVRACDALGCPGMSGKPRKRPRSELHSCPVFVRLTPAEKAEMVAHVDSLPGKLSLSEWLRATMKKAIDRGASAS